MNEKGSRSVACSHSHFNALARCSHSCAATVQAAGGGQAIGDSCYAAAEPTKAAGATESERRGRVLGHFTVLAAEQRSDRFRGKSERVLLLAVASVHCLRRAEGSTVTALAAQVRVLSRDFISGKRAVTLLLVPSPPNDLVLASQMSLLGGIGLRHAYERVEASELFKKVETEQEVSLSSHHFSPHLRAHAAELA